ncbi:HPF/RaiA family ribosome-associated protein [Chthoniobacter flavus]|uniref:HPF/RaiA family ribosome-associated protein n=1 Tax=Chthoniobacter flavus TaxID=191863 RepID=UPI003B4357F9
MTSSDAVVARIEKETEALSKFYDRMTRCHVQLEAPAQHHHHGTPFHVRIEVHVPGKELVVAHAPTCRPTVAQDGDGHRRKSHDFEAAHKDAYVAIRDGFRAMRRQLQDHVRRLQAA